jgi:NAD(P)-dependent dehydrogenase (short-subunit alcohol dehydrogenase family)
MGVAVVTGANRGIGLEFVRQLAARGCVVVAVCRQRSSELEALASGGAGRVRIEAGIDVADPPAWSDLARRLAKDEIDLLINNAGVLHADSLAEVEPDDVLGQIGINAVAPLFITRALKPRLAKDAKVALITSRMGSIADNGSGGYYGYRMSKAALNAAGMSLARDLRPGGVAVVMLHPGAVRTGMTGGRGQIDAPDAVRGLLARIDELSLATTGRFLHQNGEVLPW